MTKERYHQLMILEDIMLSEAEQKEGWHYCNEFDGLLVGPGMGELRCCKCLMDTHPIYKTIPPMETVVEGPIV